MKESVIINGKSYVPAEITFGTACKLERMGINIFEVGNTPLTLLCGYVALTVGCNLDEASDIIDAHLSSGGDFNEIFDVVSDALDNSDFFREHGKGKKNTPKKQ